MTTRRSLLSSLSTAFTLVAAVDAGAQTLSWSGPTNGSQNMATTATLALTTPGTYTITADSGMVVTFKGAAGGGGGGGNSWHTNGAGGGGGGATTTGTSVQLIPGKTYTLVVGAGGAGGGGGGNGGAGGATRLTNTTDGMTLVLLNGGGGGVGQGGPYGNGGVLVTGTSGVTGGRGGSGGAAASASANANAGGAGVSATNGAGGGGGGGGGITNEGTPYDAAGGGRGGDGSNAGSPGGGLSASGGGGGTNGGGGGGGYGGTYNGGGGGGGGGGASFSGVTGGYGGGGGGAGGIDGASQGGGSGRPGVAVLNFVSSCGFSLSPTSGTAPVGGTSGTVSVTTGSACAWTAGSTASWLSITSGGSGTGNGTISYSASANTSGLQRSAVITVGGQNMTVTQEAGATSDPLLTWSGPTSGTQNLSVLSSLAFATAGTYTLTINTAAAFTFKGVAGGGGGGGNSWHANGAGGGGGGASTTGTSMQLLPGKTYTLVVGAGGGGGSSSGGSGGTGGATRLTNTTDGVTLVLLNGGGGGGGQGGLYGNGGALVTGSNGVTGGRGGSGGSAATSSATASGGGAGTSATNGAGGGGGGGGGITNEGTPYDAASGGRGGDGSNAGSPGGGLSASGAGGGTNGFGGGGGYGGTYNGGGGGGGGGGASFSGVTGGYGGGGGGAGGIDGASQAGGSGRPGVTVLSFVSTCGIVVSPAAITSPAAANSGSVVVSANSACAWTASSSATWLTITSATGGGSGTVAYSAASNTTGAVRTATLTVAGFAIAVTQPAIDHVVVTPSAPTVLYRGSQVFTATAYDVTNTVTPGVTFSWTTSDTTIVSVPSVVASSVTASAIGVSASPVTVSATPSSGPSGTAQVTVDPGQVLVFDTFGGAGTAIVNHTPNVHQIAGPWTLTGTPGAVVGGGLAHPTGIGTWTQEATIEAGAADAIVSADWIPASTDNAYGGIVFRWSDPTHYWVAAYFHEDLSLVKRTPTQAVTMGSVQVGPRQNRHLEIRLSGNNIQVWSDGALQIQVTDWYNAAATQHGLQWWSAADPWSSLTNFEVDGTLAPEVATITLNGSATMLIDETQTMTATPRDGSGNPVSGAVVRWSATDERILQLTPTTAIAANVTAKEIGTVTVTARAPRGPVNGASLTIAVSACVDPLATTTITAPPGGGAGSIAVTTSAGCVWNARSEAPWITITAGANGTGPRTVNFTTTANGSGARSGTIFLGGRRLTISQDGTPCTFTMWPVGWTAPGSGGTFRFDVQQIGGCAWFSALDVPGPSWIQASGDSGNVAVDGTVTYTLAANPDQFQQRTAVIHINAGSPGTGSVDYVVTQDVADGAGSSAPSSPPGCVVSVTGSPTNFNPVGGIGTASVTAATGCEWRAISQEPWLSVSEPNAGSGNGAVTFTVSSNGGSSPRIGRILFGTQVLTVTEQSTGSANCPTQPNGNDTEDDTAAIQCLLDNVETVVLDADVSSGYYIGNPGLKLRHNGATFTSASSYGNRALLLAHPALRHPILQIDSANVSNFRIEKIWFYGNKFSRPCDLSEDLHENVNVRLRGGPFVVDNVASDTAPCASGMIVDDTTHDFEISNSWFAFNGFSQPNPGHDPPAGYQTRYSDGLTVHACTNGLVHDNHFLDNSDVDLIFGGTRREELGHPNATCRVYRNDIRHSSNYGFAGLMLTWFSATRLTADHTGAEYFENTISSAQDMLSFGIMIGHHPWNSDVLVTNAGIVRDNTATGANVNLAVDGADTGTVSQNAAPGSRGTTGFYCTALGADYTAADAGAMAVQPGFVIRRFHREDCPSR